MSPTRPAPNNLASSPRLAGTNVPGLVVLMVCMVSSGDLVVRASADAVLSAELGQVTYGRDAGQEEVHTSPSPDELRQATVAVTDRPRRDGEGCACRVVFAGQRVRVVVEAVKGGIVQPCVLDEFELPGQVGRQGDEVQPVLAVGRAGAVRRQALA